MPEPLSTLLTWQENNDIIELFDQYDKDGDGTISAEEIADIERSKWKDKCRSTADIDDCVKFWLKFRDSDKDGRLSWDEFLQFEALSAIERRGPDEMALLLSDDEVAELRVSFDDMDKNCDGVLTKTEMERSMRSRYSHLVVNGALTEEGLAVSVGTYLKEIMEADVDYDNCVSWEEYVRFQAKFILAQRPKM